MKILIVVSLAVVMVGGSGPSARAHGSTHSELSAPGENWATCAG
jgi:hypothetical protein